MPHPPWKGLPAVSQKSATKFHFFLLLRAGVLTPILYKSGIVSIGIGYY